MKNNILLIIALSISAISFGQNVTSSAGSVTTERSYFFDASSNTFNTKAHSGRGLNFPRTDLTTFEFDLQDLGGYQYSLTAFDGFVVYNTASGQTIADTTKGGTQVSVEPGFYYFSNPNGSEDDEDVSTGVWKPLSSATTTGSTPKFWTLDGNGGTSAVKRDDIDAATYTFDAETTDGAGATIKKHFIGTNDANNVTLATGHSTADKRVARLTVGEINGVTVGATDFDFVMEVYGKAHFTQGIVTSKSTYPDYVFDNYYTGTSNINKDYKFLSLNEVESFIKENNHLPGVTKIDEFAKDGDNYLVDTTATAIETLEKVEELYLHVIEQQKEIEALKAEIAELKK